MHPLCFVLFLLICSCPRQKKLTRCSLGLIDSYYYFKRTCCCLFHKHAHKTKHHFSPFFLGCVNQLVCMPALTQLVGTTCDSSVCVCFRSCCRASCDEFFTLALKTRHNISQFPINCTPDADRTQNQRRKHMLVRTHTGHNLFCLICPVRLGKCSCCAGRKKGITGSGNSPQLEIFPCSHPLSL